MFLFFLYSQNEDIKIFCLIFILVIYEFNYELNAFILVIYKFNYELNAEVLYADSMK